MKYVLGWIGVSMILLTGFNLIFAAPPGEEEVRESLLHTTAKIRHGEGRTWEDDKIVFEVDPEMALHLIQPFEQDESSYVRSYAYRSEWKIARSSSRFRRDILERLIYAICYDPEPSLAESLYQFVYKFSLIETDFTEQAKSWIREHLATETPREEVILLAGIADLQDQIPRLKALRAEASDYARIADDPIAQAFIDVRGWEARLALARMGSQEDIIHCIEKIEASPTINERIGYLLRYYGYIRQPETIAMLRQYLDRKERFSDGSYYAARAQDIVAEIVEGFPGKADLETARAWMKSQKEFKIKR